MRKLAWAAAGFALAAFTAEYFVPVKGLPFLAAALFGLIILLFAAKPLRERRAQIFVIAACVGLLFWWGHYMLHVRPCEELAGQERVITARLTDYPTVSEEYSRLTVRVTSGAPKEKAVLYLYDEDLPDGLQPGDEISVTVRIRSARVTRGSTVHTYTSKNQNLLGTMLEEPVVTGRWGASWLYFPQRLAQLVKTVTNAVFSGDAAVFMTALLTGDTANLYADNGLYNSLRSSGVMHIVAVSGMHLSILVSALFLFTGKKKKLSLIAVPFILVFVMMAGCRAAVVRAAVMEIFFLLAPLVNRENDSLTSLMAALLLLLLINPMAIGGTGLQLSFACVLGFVLVSPQLTEPKKDKKKRKAVGRMLVNTRRGVRNSLLGTLCAGCFSLIPAGYYFGTISFVSPLANLLTLPVISVVFACGYICVLFGSIWLPVGKVLAAGVSLAVRYCLGVYRFLAKVPLGCLYTKQPGVLVICGILLMLLIASFWNKTPHRARRFSAIACVLLFSGTLLAQGSRLRRSAGELAVLDVGAGQCVVLADSSHAVVIACGGSTLDDAGDTVANFLLSQGIQHVDALILPDLDESMTNGVTMLLTRMDVGCLIVPAFTGWDDYADIAAAARENGAALSVPETDTGFTVGNITCEIYPTQLESELTVSAQIGGKNILILSGGKTQTELDLLQRGCISDTDYLVIGRESLDSGCSSLLLETAQAETAIISAEDLTYSYYTEDAQAAISRTGEYCGQTLLTDEQGDIIVYIPDLS